LSSNAIINNDFAKRSAIPDGRYFRRLALQIQQVGSAINILEVGCGNGWLAAKLAGITSGEVIGVDIDKRELQQAKRVFASLPNLKFLPKDISGWMFPDKKFDIIVFAGSIQYLSSLKETIANALEHLTLMGQIHILDSAFYPRKSEQHFYHDINELESFQFKVLFNPDNWINRLVAPGDLFYHIVIKNRYH
jgi:ubiquinone/menaquinone biosynthesis C-methylase UbiE